jgi:hypothetical protein
MIRRTTPRRHATRQALAVTCLTFGVVAPWRRATGQGGWAVVPVAPTVGDTVWLSRAVAADAGWRVRPGRLDPAQEVESLGDPEVARVSGGWLVRYPVVLWTPGRHEIALPPVWRLGPAGQADSVPGGTVALQVRRVLPDSGTKPDPKPALGPLGREQHSAWPPAAAASLAVATLAAGIWARRRGPRRVPPPPPIAVGAEVADAKWLAAGEPKAVAARATARLRAALGKAVPQAHPALSTAECLAAVAAHAPGAPHRELRELLVALDQICFATAHGTDVAALAARAGALARGLAP